MNFFCTALDPKNNVDKRRLENQANKRKSDLKSEEIKNYVEMHSDVLLRILFIYAKLNPGITYI